MKSKQQNMERLNISRSLVTYSIKFLAIFCALFFGTEAVIGLSAPGGSYNAFVANYLDFISPLRGFLLLSSQTVLSWFGYPSHLDNQFTLHLQGGSRVRMVYSCIGYGLLSFWMAFVFANQGTWKKKAAWIFFGCMVLVLINILRIALLLVAISHRWPIPFGWDHHTWFNIVAYLLIFGMIYFFKRSEKKEVKANGPAKSLPATEKAATIS